MSSPGQTLGTKQQSLHLASIIDLITWISMSVFFLQHCIMGGITEINSWLYLDIFPSHTRYLETISISSHLPVKG